METTTDQLIPYPTDDDFGNGALQLQYLAQTVDSKLYAQELAFRDLLYPPVKLLGTSGQLNLAANVANVITFNRQIFNRGFSNSTTVVLPENGTYMMGIYIDAVCQSTVTAGSVRGVSISFSLPVVPDPISGLVVQKATNSIVEPGTGDSYLTTQLIFDYQAVSGISPIGPTLNFFHTNTGSLMNIQTTSYFWIIKLSDLGS